MGRWGSGGASANSRWNPTKEQISVLESLYRQGVRTPNAEQIQQITSRLSAFSHIEGKNVFYWFQNHKARQRQKPKQETLAFVNGFLPTDPLSQPVFPSHYATQNVMCSPHYLRLCVVRFYEQYDSKFLLHGCCKTRSRTSNLEKRTKLGEGGEPIHPECNYTGYKNGGSHIVDDVIKDKETLALFPLHPTENLHRKISETSIDEFSTSSSSSGFEQGCNRRTFVDFF